LCLETHKHMGTTFQGTQISTPFHLRAGDWSEGWETIHILFQPLHALATSSDNYSQLCELWHQRMAHLHHGALGGLREVVTGMP
jgi:hypothetical protein